MKTVDYFPSNGKPRCCSPSHGTGVCRESRLGKTEQDFLYRSGVYVIQSAARCSSFHLQQKLREGEVHMISRHHVFHSQDGPVCDLSLLSTLCVTRAAFPAPAFSATQLGSLCALVTASCPLFPQRSGLAGILLHIKEVHKACERVRNKCRWLTTMINPLPSCCTGAPLSWQARCWHGASASVCSHVSFREAALSR